MENGRKNITSICNLIPVVQQGQINSENSLGN